MNKLLLALLFIFITLLAFSENTADTVSIDTKSAYMETLKYGIEKEIINIFDELGNNPSNDFYTILIERYKTSMLPTTKTAFINYFANCENLPQEIINILYNDTKNEPENNKEHSALLLFLGKKGKLKEGLLLIERLDHYEIIIQNAASDALSKMNNKELVQPILKRLKESEEDDDKYLSNDIKSKLILSFGEMKALEAVSYLRDIIKDSANDKYMIMFGMYSLAKIGDVDSIKEIEMNLENEDLKIQEYAGYALSQYNMDSVTPILSKMLRHNNEKVRIYACQGIVNNKSTNLIPVLEYKLKNDPSSKVKNEALNSLIYLGDQGINIIKNILSKEKNKENYLYLISEAVRQKPKENNVRFLLSLYNNATEKQQEIIARNIVNGTSNKLDPIVLKLTESTNHLIRIGASKAIYNIQNTSLLPKLKELSKNDPSPLVQKTASKYLSLKNNN